MLALVASRAAKRGRQPVDDQRALDPYVSLGRWVADCPHCNSGIAIHPEWSIAACLGCHRVFRDIRMPAAWKQIDEVLAFRPVVNQHWLSSAVRTKWFGRGGKTLPDEPLDDLKAENRSRGLPTGGKP